ncbi:MAG: FKBP-type peptidyl-prolyl cis-trans isomerase [Bacteroidales bacterium]
MQRLVHWVVLFLLLLAVGACQSRERHNPDAPNRMPDTEELIRANRILMEEDNRRIAGKALQAGWNLTQTETGEYYQLLTPQATGVSDLADRTSILPGDEVVLSYTLRLLGGELIRSSDDSGPKRFIVEGSEAESGLHSLIKNFTTGDSLRIILPPHRAFGLMGDGDKIPGRAILWYEVRVDSVRPAVRI